VLRGDAPCGPGRGSPIHPGFPSPDPDSPCVQMNRSDIRSSIDFRGLIRGCPDHQWLIADAIWETGAGTGKARWLVSTEERISRPSGTVTEDGDAASSSTVTRQRVVTIRDHWTGWKAQGATAAEVARRIRAQYDRSDRAPNGCGDGAAPGSVAVPERDASRYPSATNAASGSAQNRPN